MAELEIVHTRLFAESLQAIDEGYKIIVHQGGTRSSKTYSLAQLYMYLMVKPGNKTFSVVRKTMPALRQTAMKDFFTILADKGLYSEMRHNKSENVYKFGGNSIDFFSVDEPQKVRGRKRHYLWINEANELDVEDYRQLLVRTEDKIFMDFNPSISEDHWIINEVLSRDDAKLIVSTYKDNYFLSAEQVAEIERFKMLDPGFWRVYGEGMRSDLQTGTVFPRNNYREYDVIPADIKSVIYCDPNLAIKSKGDSTAITHLGFSAKTGKYYVIDAVCESFSDTNELLNTIFHLRMPFTTAIGFDGNVSQESTWTNFVKNWARIHNQPFPRIEYKRYRVDDLAKNTQIEWNMNNILFPAGFSQTLSGKLYLNQVFNFTSKRAKNPDDAPDSLICSYEFIHERRLTTKPQPLAGQPTFRQPIDF